MAQYTRLTGDEIKQILIPYSLSEIRQITPMRGGQANSSYLVETRKDRVILSICDEKDRDETQVLTKVLEYFETQGFPTSRIVKTSDGRSFILYRGKPAYVKQYMAGRVTPDITPAMAGQIGAAVARLNEIPAPDYLPDRFPYGMAAFPTIFDVDHPYVEWLKQKHAFLERRIDPTLPRGLIHGDIFWDNLLFDGDRLAAILDFEEACRYFKLYDIGVAAMGCCTTAGKWDAHKIRGLIQGYRSVSTLPQNQIRQLKLFMEYAGVAGSFWRFRQYNIRYPDRAKAQSYKELSGLADQIHAMSDAAYNEFIFSGGST